MLVGVGVYLTSSVAKYDETFRGYDELYREEQYSKYSYIIDRGLIPRAQLLDLGCGTGLFYSFLKERDLLNSVYMYICLDPSIGMISLSVERSKKDYRVLHILAYGEHLPIRDHAVGSIYSITVWDNVDDKEAFLKQLLKALDHKEGFAVISFLKKKARYNRSLLVKLATRFGVAVDFIGCNDYDCFTAIRKRDLVLQDTVEQ